MNISRFAPISTLCPPPPSAERVVSKKSSVFVASLLLALTGCAYAPVGANVRVMPAQGKPFEQFRAEQDYCELYASDRVAGQAENANSMALLQTIGGAALGAGLGAAVDGGNGAAVGAASGAVAGALVGAGSSSEEKRSIQDRYDDAYVQCMVAKGNLVERPVVYSPPAQTTVIYKTSPTVIYEPGTTVIYEPAPVVVYPRRPHHWHHYR